MIAGATSHAGMSQGAKALQTLGLRQHIRRPAKRATCLAAVPEDAVPALVERADGMPWTPVKPRTGEPEGATSAWRSSVLSLPTSTNAGPWRPPADPDSGLH